MRCDTWRDTTINPCQELHGLVDEKQEFLVFVFIL
jgi:hypothetical protein